MKVKKEYIFLFLAIIIASVPIFNICKLIDIKDTCFWIKRVDGLVHSIDSGNLIYRINPVANLSYGGADPIFYPYIFMYILYLLFKLTNNYNISINLFFLLMNIGTAFLMYYSVQKLFDDKRISLLSTILYILSYLRIRSIFASMCIGECLAISFIPLVIEGYVNIMRGKTERWIDLFIGCFFILQSHIITSFYIGSIIIIVSLIFIPYLLKDIKKIFALLKTSIFLIGLNLWYYVPLIDYYISNKIVMPEVGTEWALAGKLTFVDSIILSTKIFIHNIHYDLFDFTYDRISYMSCLMIVFLLIYFIYYMIHNKKIKFTFDKILFLVLGIIVFINLLASAGIFTRTFFGKILFIQQYFNFQQFENREIKRCMPIICILFSYIFVKKIDFKLKKITYIVMIIFMIVPLVGLFGFINKNVKTMDDCKDFSNGDYIVKKCLPGHIIEEIKVNNHYSLPKDIFDGEIKTSSNVKLKNIKKKFLGYQVDYEKIDKNDGYIKFPLFNYDGYEALNKKKKNLKIKSSDNSLIQISIKDEKGFIDLHFKENIKWLICDIISLIGFVILMFVCVKSKKKRMVYEN